MSETILRVEHVTKKFPVSGGRFLTACDDITFDVHETVAVVGESGCGKITLLKANVRICTFSLFWQCYSYVFVPKFLSNCIPLNM